MKKIVLFSILITIVLVVGEIFSWAFFEVYGKYRLRANIKLDAESLLQRAVSQKELPVRKEFVMEGMAPRRAPVKWIYDIASAYGDSFTYCSEVSDDETWPYYLSEIKQANVINYGKPGFGPDEAVLKMEDNLKQGMGTKIVILTILAENIGRVVNSFPVLFLLYKRHLYFKPIIIDGPDGGFVWKRDYLRRLDTETGKDYAINLTRTHDFWYKYDQHRLTFEFPYLLQSFKTAYYLTVHHTNWLDLWGKERPVSVMREIVIRFFQLSKQYKFEPVLVFIPADTIRLETGEEPTYANFISSLKRENSLRGLKIIDIAKEFPPDFPPEQFNVNPHSGHASPAGNRLIAAAVARRIER